MQRWMIGLAVLLVSLAAGHAWGAERAVLPGPIPAQVLQVVDGDTVDVRARVWLGQDIRVRVRLAGIDAPEARSGCPAERRLASAAYRQLKRLVGQSVVALRNVRPAKYASRVIAEVWTAQAGNVSATLLSAGLARVYSGRGRGGWCCGKRLCETMERFDSAHRLPQRQRALPLPAHEIAGSMQP